MEIISLIFPYSHSAYVTLPVCVCQEERETDQRREKENKPFQSPPWISVFDRGPSYHFI